MFQVLISLCIAGLSAAAVSPKQPRTGRQSNEAQIVSDVVTTLQPEIAAAVANALAGLQSQQQFSNNRADFGGNSFNNDELTNPPASYNYQYQVRDDEEGTYIFKNEARDGLDVTGTYGYVNPEGTLITVNYEAGPEGFSQTLEREVDFLRSSGNGNANFGGSRRPAPAPAPVRPRQPAGIDEGALIAQIISALQPQINASVNAAISSQQQQTVSRSAVSQQGGARSGDRLVPLFGFNQA